MILRVLTLLGVFGSAAITPLAATTLQQLSLDAMIAQSSAIVRGYATPVSSFQRGSMIYTSYRFEISSTLKGKANSVIEIAVPGGDFAGKHQAVAGAPALQAGTEYVIFVWTSPSGIHHIIGLNQGMYELHVNSTGETVLTRGPLNTKTLDAAGKGAADSAQTLRLNDLSARIARSVN